MPYTDVSVCNLAIDKVSGDRIDAMDEETPLAAFCLENYPHKRDVILGKYRWTFANAVALLTRMEPDADEPRPCAFKYARPADLSGAVHAWRDAADPQRAQTVPYVLEVNGFYWSDQSPLFAEYTAVRDEQHWPTWFRDLVVIAFAADLATHCQMRTLSRDLETRAWGTPQENGEGGLYAQARNEDARMAPQRQLVSGVDPGPLVGTRYGSGYGYRPGFPGFTLQGG